MSQTASASARRKPDGPQVAGVVGSPRQVARSLSPAIHNAAFSALEMDWVYLAFGVADRPARAVRGLGAAGVRGMNITMPHKVSVMEAMDGLSDAATSIGAVNTVEAKAGKLIGHNTDGEGLVRFLQQDAGVQVAGAPVVIIGAGGSARAAVYSLSAAGAKSVTVLARDPMRAQALAPLAQGRPFLAEALDWGGAREIEKGSIVVNATPVGQQSESSPVPPEAMHADCVVVDLIYEPAVTPLVQAARSRGAIAHSGLGMLLNQAAASFEIWTGVEPPMEAMSAAAVGAMRQE